MKKIISLSIATLALIFATTFAFAGNTSQAYYSSKTAKTTMFPPQTDIPVWNNTPYWVKVTAPVYMDVAPGKGERIYNDNYIYLTHIEIADQYNRLIFSGDVRNHYIVTVYINAFGQYAVNVAAPLAK